MRKYFAINNKNIFLLMAIFPLFACAKVPYQDKEMSAIEGNDLTALIEGCGTQLVSGLTLCRKREGDSSGDQIYFVGPITNCKRDACVEFKIFGIDGSLIYGGAIPKSKNRIGVPWSIILKRPTFELSDRGFWLIIYSVFWLDADKNEHISKSEGDIYLRVLKKDYVPLNEVVSDSNFTWEFQAIHGEHVKMTTGLRTYVGQRPPPKPKGLLPINWRFLE